jgi:acyl homoserine lactone synthase
MFVTIEAHQYEMYRHLLDKMFRLRARVFADKLGWDVPVRGGMERDRYDDLSPLYLIATDAKQQEVYACMRFLPTTGPTLLADVFHETMAEEVDLDSPFIWECTRFCVDEELIAQQDEAIDVVRLGGQMLIACCEFGLRSGIDQILANFDPIRLRIWRRAGAKVDVIGKSESFGERPVYLGLFEVSEEVLHTMRYRLGVTEPLLAPLYNNGIFGNPNLDLETLPLAA